jgi:hypothetical protein
MRSLHPRVSICSDTDVGGGTVWSETYLFVNGSGNHGRQAARRVAIRMLVQEPEPAREWAPRRYGADSRALLPPPARATLRPTPS